MSLDIIYSNFYSSTLDCKRFSGVRWKKTGSVIARARRPPAARRPSAPTTSAAPPLARPRQRRSPPEVQPPLPASFAAPVPRPGYANYDALFSGLMVVRRGVGMTPAARRPAPSPSPPPPGGSGGVYVTEMHEPRPSPSPPPCPAMPRWEGGKGVGLLLAAAKEE